MSTTINKITLTQASDLLKLSLEDLHSLIFRGQICYSQDENGQILIDKECIDNLMLNNGHVANHDQSMKSVDDIDFISKMDSNLDSYDYLKSEDTITDSEVVSQSSEVIPFDRDSISSLNLTKIVASAQYATEKLHDAMYRIGYLEAQNENLKSQIDAFTDLNKVDTSWIELVKENDFLKSENEKLLLHKMETIH